MIQKLLFSKIKALLEEKYELDMTSSDIRLAYVIYNVLMQEYHDIVNMRLILMETYQAYIDQNVSYVTFERGIYRTLQKITKDSKPNDVKFVQVKLILAIAEEIEV